jgi:hypothetical protein
MKKITNLLESKRSIAGLFLLAGLIYTTHSIQDNSAKIKRLTNFESGIQTCFTRVNQTYTANILGDKASNYLTQNFQNLTEECFAEGILSVENSLKAELSGVAKQLSNLASNVHWFHEDILSPNSAKGLVKSGEGRDVGTRFERIETRKDEILEASDKYKTLVTDSLNQQKNLFYISATMLVMLMLAEYMSLTRRRLSNSAREKEALAELMDNGGATSVKVGEIVRVALEQNDLLNCSKLFSNFHAYTQTERGKNKLSLEALVTPMAASQIAKAITPSEASVFNDSTIDKIWADDNIGVTADVEVKALDDINLEQMSSSIVDLLAEKLFSQGVHFNVNIAENLSVQGKTEDLEQTLFHLFNYAINATQSGNGEKNISVVAHKLGDIVSFDLSHSGAGFDERILKQRAGLVTDNIALDVDLQICQSLLSEIQAKTQFDNKIDQSGNIVGGRVKVIFKAAKTAIKESSQGRLVDLKVGSKKEILASFNNG